MFNRGYYENSQAGGIAVLEVTPAEENAPRLFVPLKRTELLGKVIGPLAALRLVQTYGYTRAQCDKTLEAVYRFPLPGDAAVTRVRVRFGDVEIEAELKERAQAEAEYEEAKKQGQQAALATRESPDVFTLQVAGLQPDQDVTVETHYVQLAKVEGAGWSLRAPLTTSPRYVRSDEQTAHYAQGQPLALLRDPGHRFALDVLLKGAGAVSGPTHALDVTAEGSALRVRLKDGEVLPDRDCVLTWQPAQEQSRPTFQVFLHDDATAGQVYFLALVAPPAAAGRRAPREALVLVDHSGSMEGAKWEATDWAVKRFLSDLDQKDALALCLFHSTTRWFAAKPEPATEATVEAAIKFLEEHRDSGGTELGVALEQALSLPRAREMPARHLLIVTDAEVSDAGRILRLADEEAGQGERRRISVLCIDAAPNAFLASELAERGGGVARFLTSAPSEGDITTALDEVMADWGAPVAAGLRLEVNRAGAEAAGRVVTATAGGSAIDLGDLPAGRALWVAGRIPKEGGAELTFRLVGRDHAPVATRQFGAGLVAGAQPALKALFGARRVLGLEYLINAGYGDEELRAQLKRLGYDPDAALAGPAGARKKLYAENQRQEASAALKGLLVEEALRYGVACMETAFVAVRKEAGKVIEGTVAVANALPAGWSPGFLAGPSPTAPAPMTLGAGMGVGMPLRGVMFSMAAPTTGAADDAAPYIVARKAGPPAKKEAAKQKQPPALFAGAPQFVSGAALLFDSARPEDRDKLPAQTRLTGLELRFAGKTPEVKTLHPDLALLIFVGDLSAPRARVRLVDLLRQRGQRPLNLMKAAGDVVRIVLEDPAGAWAGGAPAIEVVVHY